MAVRAAPEQPVRRIACALLLLAGGFAAPSLHAQESVTTRIDRTSTTAQVLGSQYRDAVQQATRAASRGDLERALEVLRPALAFCDGLLAQGHRLVSVADQAEYTDYVASAGGGEPVDWVDMACPEAFHAVAFVAIERKDADAAFAALDKATRFAPYWVDPLTERGHLLNMTGKPAQGLATYQAALALVESHASNRPMHALVLRGIGYSQVELGDLDAAERAYRASLKIEPGNALAQKELEYIRQQRDKARPAAKP